MGFDCNEQRGLMSILNDCIGVDINGVSYLKVIVTVKSCSDLEPATDCDNNGVNPIRSIIVDDGCGGYALNLANIT